jgi:hypothetical protein
MLKILAFWSLVKSSATYPFRRFILIGAAWFLIRFELDFYFWRAGDIAEVLLWWYLFGWISQCSPTLSIGNKNPNESRRCVRGGFPASDLGRGTENGELPEEG